MKQESLKKEVVIGFSIVFFLALLGLGTALAITFFQYKAIDLVATKNALSEKVEKLLPKQALFYITTEASGRSPQYHPSFPKNRKIMP